MPEDGELAFALYKLRKLLRWSDDSGGVYREIRDALVRIQLTGVQSTNAYYSAADEGVDGLMVTFRTMFDPEAAGDLEARYELVLGGQAFGIEVKDGSIRVYRAAPADPDAKIETDVKTLGALVYEGGDLDEALRSGDVEIEGDRSAVGRLTDLFPLPEPAPKPASSTVASSRSSTTRQCRPDEPTKQRRRRPIVGGSTPSQGDRMKTLLVAYRVANLDRSLDFYTTLGYTKVGTVALDGGDRLAILKFPDEPAATLELVHRPGGGRVDVGSGFDHLAIQVDTLAATLKRLTEAGLEPGPVQHPAGPRGPMTSWLTDPDGYRIELVEWPPGHPDGITAADFS